jgi:predicted amidohydrolase YtcJ
LALAVCLAVTCSGCAGAPSRAAGTDPADTLYINGKVYTVDEEFSEAQAIAVKGDRLLYVGDTATALQNHRGASTKVVDLKGRTVIPGLVESHLHYQYLGYSLETIDIFQKTKEEILQKVKEEAERLPGGEWIVSSGWNHELWAVNEWPAKEDLDAAAPNNPVALARVDGHSAWYNSLALASAGITADTPDPEGGAILKNSGGGVLGILVDTAMELVNIPSDVSDARKLARYTIADQSLRSYGLTTVVDAGASYDDINILKTAYASGTLKVRAYEMLEEGQDIVYIEAGNQPVKDLYGGKLSVNAVKLYADGSLGSRSAWLKHPYTDDGTTYGNPRYDSPAAFNAIAKRVSDYGFQIGTHAIGDAAVRMVMDAYVYAAGEDLAGRRFRIEHFQIVDAEDIPTAIGLGIIPSMQTAHATSDMNMAENRVGPVRILSSYAWRAIINEGGIIANGSDAPVELVNPYYGLYAAVTRQDRLTGQPPGGWYPEQALTREEALKSFTIWGAYAAFSEDNRGSLAAGKYADFVMLDRDYMNCPAAQIKDITVLATVIGGEVVYGSFAPDPAIIP